MDSTVGNPCEQLAHELERAEQLLSDAADFVRAQASGTASPSRVGDPDIPRGANDPHVILRFGQLRARLHAAQGLLARADRAAKVNDATDTTVLVSVVEARAFIRDLVNEINGQLAAWGGPSFNTGGTHRASDERPVEVEPANHWNYHHVGSYYLKGIAPRAT